MNISSPNLNDNRASSGAVDRDPATADVESTQNPRTVDIRDIVDTLKAYDQTDVGGLTQINLHETRTLLGGQEFTVNDNVVNQRGAPSLCKPSSGLSKPDAILRMMLLGVEAANERQDAGMQAVRATSKELEKYQISLLENQKLHGENLVKQGKSNYAERIFGWIGSVAAVIGATAAVVVSGVATFFSGGMAAPLLVLSTMALGTAIMSLGNQVSRELNGPEISLQNLITSSAVSLLNSVGVDPKTAVKVGNLVAGMAAVTVLGLVEPQLFGVLAQSICEIAGVSPENAELVGTIIGAAAGLAVGLLMVGVGVCSGGLAAVPFALRMASLVIGGTASIVSGVGSIGKGATSIVTAGYVKEASYLEAENADIRTGSLMLRKQMDIDQEMIKNLMQCVEDGMRAAAQIIKDLFDNLSQISSNISRRASV